MVEIKPLKEEIKAEEVEKSVNEAKIKTALTRKLNKIIPTLTTDLEIATKVAQLDLKEAVELLKIRNAFWEFLNIKVPYGINHKEIDIKFVAREGKVLKFDILKDNIKVGDLEVGLIPTDYLTASALYTILDDLVIFAEKIKETKK
ncbi:MAG: hypothetical protein QW648_03670 [Nanoarchaeales archaeon]